MGTVPDSGLSEARALHDVKSRPDAIARGIHPDGSVVDVGYVDLVGDYGQFVVITSRDDDGKPVDPDAALSRLGMCVPDIGIIDKAESMFNHD